MTLHYLFDPEVTEWLERDERERISRNAWFMHAYETMKWAQENGKLCKVQFQGKTWIGYLVEKCWMFDGPVVLVMSRALHLIGPTEEMGDALYTAIKMRDWVEAEFED